MESHALLLTAPSFPAAGLPRSPQLRRSTPLPFRPIGLSPFSTPAPSTRLSALKSPKGFGPPPPKKKRPRKQRRGDYDDDDDEDLSDEDGGDYDDDVTIPEVVTNRMMRRMGVSVGAPLAVGLLFFPFFYYLKVVLKIDVPTWVPFIVSFVFFGTALLGVSYGIVSSSWDPLREGSLLGWNEAQRNWPVFWGSLWRGGQGGSKKSHGYHFQDAEVSTSIFARYAAA